jgi:hypothetical protein
MSMQVSNSVVTRLGHGLCLGGQVSGLGLLGSNQIETDNEQKPRFSLNQRRLLWLPSFTYCTVAWFEPIQTKLFTRLYNPSAAESRTNVSNFVALNSCSSLKVENSWNVCRGSEIQL